MMSSSGESPPSSKRQKSEHGQYQECQPLQRPSSPLPDFETHRPLSPQPSTSYLHPSSPIPCDNLVRPSSPVPAYEEESNESESDFIPFNLNSDLLGDVSDENIKDNEFEFDEFVDEEYLKDLLKKKGEKPVYSGACISLHESFVSILTHALTFSLSGQCIESLLKLVNLHCPKDDNIFQPSLFLFKKYFAHIRSETHYQYFCSKCLEECPSKICKNSKCQGNAPLCYLISLPLIDSLQKLFKREEFCHKLEEHQQSRTSSEDFSDISSGLLYKEVAKAFNLTFMWYTDGATIFESAKMSAWPLMLSINELPFKERFKKENILIPALWCGPVKPHGNLLINPILPQLQQLKKGVDIDVFGKGKSTVKGIVANGTGDLPARGLMLNMVAHNGENACPRCFQSGECREGCFGVRVFPYSPSEMKLPTKEDFEYHGQIASKLKFNNAYMGVKGPTLLSMICPDPVRGTSIDAMHLIYGGCIKTLTKIFVDKDHKSLSCSVFSTHRYLIDERLQNIKLPTYLTRNPRAITDLAIWKTSQWKTWTLYLALPVLQDLLPAMNFKHLATLIAAVQFLNAEVVSKDALSTAERLICKFMDYFEDIYDRQFMTLNFHLLLHLCGVVKDQGPLWVTSCFPLESINGVLMKLVHGTRYPEIQIASSLNMIMGLTEIVKNLPDGETKNFCEKLLKTTQEGKSSKTRNCLILGKTVNQLIPPEFSQDACVNGFSEHEEVLSFKSIRQAQCVYTVDNAQSCRDSSAVLFLDNGLKLGLLKSLVKKKCKCDECDCVVFAGIQRYEELAQIPTLIQDVFVPNIHECSLSSHFVLVPSDKLHDVCVKVSLEKKIFVARRCNRQEME